MSNADALRELLKLPPAERKRVAAEALIARDQREQRGRILARLDEVAGLAREAGDFGAAVEAYRAMAEVDGIIPPAPRGDGLADALVVDALLGFTGGAS